MVHQVETRERDVVRPGEQWFFYWKTSAALWESKILELPASEVVFIPVYWGLHASSPTTWDFGDSTPERDLLRLARTLMQHRRKFCWLLPLTPAPFLPNGGVPVGAAKTLSMDSCGVHLACLDHEDKLNKMYSFFEPVVFKAYSRFCQEFGTFLAGHDIKAPAWGMELLFQDNQRPHSFLEDHSVAFNQGFSRFLKKSNPEGVEINETSSEESSKELFFREVQSLFRATAESALGPYWLGTQKIAVLGASPAHTLERSLPGGRSQLRFFQDVFSHYARHEWISTCLLTPTEKKGLLSQVLREHFGSKEAEERYHFRAVTGGDREWRAYGLVEIYDEEKGRHFRDLGLLGYLDDQYRWMYELRGPVDFTTEWIESTEHKVKFFRGAGMDRTRFGQMLKLFMLGHKIVFEKSGLSPELEKRLQIFYLENNLDLQNVNYVTQVNICELGEGKLITLLGERLLASPKKRDFWQNIFRWFNLTQPEVLMDQEVFGLWRIRETTAQDLNFLDVRRFSVYNPTSYKKHVTIHTRRHFAFMKQSGELHAQARSTPEGVEVELLPGGRLSLDFGHYEER